VIPVFEVQQLLRPGKQHDFTVRLLPRGGQIARINERRPERTSAVSTLKKRKMKLFRD